MMLFWGLQGWAQVGAEWHTQVWTVDQGLPQNSVIDMVQAPSGFLFLATEGGLVRFDGLRFRLFNSKNTPEIKNDRIYKVLIASDSSLWFINGAGQVIRLKNNQFTSFLTLPETDFNQIRVLAEDNLGNIMVGNRMNQFYKLSSAQNFKASLLYNGNFINTDEQYSHTFKAPEGSGTLVVTSKGILRFYNGNLRIDKKLNQKFGPQSGLKVVQIDQKNQFWAIKKDSVFGFTQKGLTKSVFPISFLKVYNENFNFDGAGNLWVSTSEGLFCKEVSSDTFYRFKQRGILHARCFLTDKEGNNWVGTSTEGLIRIVPNPFQHMPIPYNYQQSICAIHFDSVSETVWAISTCSGTFQLRERKLVGVANGDPSFRLGCLYGILSDTGGSVLCGTLYGTVLKLNPDGSMKKAYPSHRGLAGAIYSLVRTKEYGVLVGAEGIFQLKNDSLAPSIWSRSFKGEAVTAIYQEPGKHLWFTSKKSVGWLLPDGRVQRLKSQKSPNWAPHRGIFQGKDGTIYLGTDGAGLGVFRNQNLYYLSSNNGLPNNVISFVGEDPSGNLILSSNIGLIKLTKKNLFDFLDGKTKSIEFALFNSNDGLRNSEFNGGFTPSGVFIDKDHLVLPGLAGAVEVNLALLDRKPPVPQVFMEQILNGDSILENPKSFSTLFTSQRIEFQFTAPSFSQNKNIRFRYRLLGYDEDWVNAGNSRSAIYTKIPPGDYTFEVSVGYQNDFPANRILSLPVEILPPFYLSFWFRVLVIVLFVSLVIWVTEQRRKKAIRKASQQGALMKVVPDLMLRLDRNGQYVEYLAGSESEMVVPFDQMKGKTPEQIIPDLAPKMREQMRLANQTGKIQKHVYKLTVQDLSSRIYEWRLVSVRNGEEYLLIIRNITRQARIQKKLKQNQASLNEALIQKTNLLQQLTDTENARLTAFIDAQESERHRISQDLHDSVGQLISSVKIQAGNLERKLDPKPEVKDSIQRMVIVLDAVAQEIRNISFNLLPASFTQFGFFAALNDLLNGIRQTTKMETSLYHNTDLVDVPVRTQLYLFRMIQEAVNNIIKHANANWVEVQIINHDEILIIEISDNGMGFNVLEQTKKAGSSGLKNMNARAQVLGGTFKIESGIGGTSVFITIPTVKLNVEN